MYGGADGAGDWWDVVAWSGCESVCASVLEGVLEREFSGVLGRRDSVGEGLAVRMRFPCCSNSIDIGRAIAFFSLQSVLSLATDCSTRANIDDEAAFETKASPSSCRPLFVSGSDYSKHIGLARAGGALSSRA